MAINSRDLKFKLFSLAKKLAGMPKDAEYAIIVYEDGYVSPIISQGLFSGAIIPFRHVDHGFAVAVLHTHPVPRTAPSIADLNLLFNMSRHNTPAYLGTIYRSGSEVVLTLYIANRSVSPMEASLVLNESRVYEFLNVRGGFRESLSDKQIYEQHRLLQRLNISVERYRFKL
ncbi:MAG: hypothetical protein NDF54_05460 [archaeon GB-1867-035]|nr:hypothetical protein [Candidatus Culexmicrobium profundum]